MLHLDVIKRHVYKHWCADENLNPVTRANVPLEYFSSTRVTVRESAIFDIYTARCCL